MDYYTLLSEFSRSKSFSWFILILLFTTFTIGAYTLMSRNHPKQLFTNSNVEKYINSSFDKSMCTCDDCKHQELITQKSNLNAISNSRIDEFYERKLLIFHTSDFYVKNSPNYEK